FQAGDGIRDYKVTGVQTCALPISCAVPPKNDTGTTAFYPTFGQSVSGGKCAWQFGNYSASTGGAGVQFGHDLFKLAYLVFGGGGALTYRFNDVRHFGPSGCGVSAG